MKYLQDISNEVQRLIKKLYTMPDRVQKETEVGKKGNVTNDNSENSTNGNSEDKNEC